MRETSEREPTVKSTPASAWIPPNAIESSVTTRSGACSVTTARPLVLRRVRDPVGNLHVLPAGRLDDVDSVQPLMPVRPEGDGARDLPVPVPQRFQRRHDLVL